MICTDLLTDSLLDCEIVLGVSFRLNTAYLRKVNVYIYNA